MLKEIGIDCATALTAELALKFRAQGVRFVGRYVTPGSWKTLGPSEAAVIRASGLSILSVFERTADRTKGGAVAGREDGQIAYAHARSIGQPTGSAIYFAVDYDAPASDFDRIEAYLRAAAKEIPGYAIGVYGSYSVVEAMAARGAVKYFWQTVAWSRGSISSRANVYQRQIDVRANGIGVDWNDLYGEAGLWGQQCDLKMEEEEVGVPKLNPDVARNIIDSYLSPEWYSLNTQMEQALKLGDEKKAAACKQLRDWQHYLANELRAAAGITTSK
ncbi:hypothetical protein J31TS4_15760 [Paenibacillus sp. J31TS4]|uniref:DUF1906 domain-containing protein n=1 Tax=Paenibacillus sp. J31TS4 TaxID=2807195 RepID=UPI001B2E4552|nr:DUF1906 domain-containing protein [Paenibacillus sp. J31TS4]GIP38296.1 hypothetical protein J31TS4_15760 [Paenibacillus sp. J31TS4]